MNKWILFLIVLFLGYAASAQRSGRDDGPAFSWSGEGKGNGIPTVFGLATGLSLSSVYGSTNSPVTGASARTGIAFSAYMAVPVSKKFFVRTEIGYLQTGARNDSYQYDADYFIIPLLASFEINRNHSLRLLFGPQLGCLLSASKSNAGVKTDISDMQHINELSLAGGAEWNPKHFGLFIRGQYGLTNVSRVVGVKMMNRVISGGISFRL